MTFPVTALSPSGAEVEVNDPTAERIESAYLAGRDYSREREFYRLQAVSLLLRSQAEEFEALAEACNPYVAERKERIASFTENARVYRECAERYRRLAEGH